MPRLLESVLAVCALGGVATAKPHLTGLPGKQETARTVVLSADVACAPARAYWMWTTEDGVKSFFAPAARIGGVGGPYAVMFFPKDDPEGVVHGTAGAHLLAAEPDRFVAFEWVVFAGDKAKGDHAPPYAPPAERMPAALPTWVEIELTPSGRGAHVEFRHFGFGEGELWGRSHAWFTRAWSGVLANMVEACKKAQS